MHPPLLGPEAPLKLRLGHLARAVMQEHLFVVLPAVPCLGSVPHLCCSLVSSPAPAVPRCTLDLLTLPGTLGSSFLPASGPVNPVQIHWNYIPASEGLL